MNAVLRISLLWLGLAIGSVPVLAQTQFGVVRAVRVTGEVNVSISGGEQVSLVEGQLLKEQSVVSTGANGRVTLLFSSGSTVSLRSNSVLRIEAFRQDPFQPANLAGLQAEPSRSRTNLLLERGGYIGATKKLQANSEFVVRTPLGQSTIRGTRWEHTFETSTGIGTNTTATGLVEWQGAFAGVEPLGVQEGMSLLAYGTFAATGELATYRVELVAANQNKLREIEELADQSYVAFGDSGSDNWGQPSPEGPPGAASPPATEAGDGGGGGFGSPGPDGGPSRGPVSPAPTPNNFSSPA